MDRGHHREAAVNEKSEAFFIFLRPGLVCMTMAKILFAHRFILNLLSIC